MAVFTEAVQALPVESRTLIYIAGQKTVFTRGSWDNCIFNSATGMKTSSASANFLGVAPVLVADLICVWDDSRDQYPTNVEAHRALMDTLVECGIDTGLVSNSNKNKRSFIKSITRKVQFRNEELADFNDEVGNLIDSFTETQEDKTDLQLQVEEIESIFACA